MQSHAVGFGGALLEFALYREQSVAVSAERDWIVRYINSRFVSAERDWLDCKIHEQPVGFGRKDDNDNTTKEYQSILIEIKLI